MQRGLDRQARTDAGVRTKRQAAVNGKRNAQARGQVRSQKFGEVKANAQERMGKMGKTVQGKINNSKFGPKISKGVGKIANGATATKGMLYKGRDKLGRTRMLRRPVAATAKVAKAIGTGTKESVKYGLRNTGIRDPRAVGRAIRGIDSQGAGLAKMSAKSRAKALGSALGGKGNMATNLQRGGLILSGLEAASAVKRANDRRTGKSKEEGGLAGDLGKVGGALVGGWAGERAARRGTSALKRASRTQNGGAGTRSKIISAVGKVDSASRAKIDMSKGLKGVNKRALAKYIGANALRRGGRGGAIIGASIAGGVAAGYAAQKVGKAIDKKVGAARRKRKS